MTTAASYPLAAVFVTTKRSNAKVSHGVSKGSVFDQAGHMIGAVGVHSRDASGTYGPNGPAKRRYWWACALDREGRVAGYLGTRHETRAHAMRALRLFRAALLTTTDYDHIYLGVARFKRDNREVCALDASPMVRVYDPDRPR